MDGYGLEQVRPLAAIGAIMAIAWALSENRGRFPWRMALGALALQAGLVLLVFALPGTDGALAGLSAAVDGLAHATQAGAAFVFGYLAFAPETPGPFVLAEGKPAPFIFAFQVLPLILVISALSALLWRWGVLGLVVRGFGYVFRRALGLGGASATAAAANIFLGMVESPIVIRPYLARLTRSEIFLMMTLGLATVAGSTMAAYALILGQTLPNAAAHVLVASIISAPAAVLLARIMVPETETAETLPVAYDASPGYASSMDALVKGVEEGLFIVFNVAATLLVFTALVALINLLLALGPDIAGAPLTLERAAGVLFAPAAWAIGAPWAEAATAGNLLGVKLFLTEFTAFLRLGELPPEALTERTRMILTYALCGFANIGSVGVMVGGMVKLFPPERRDLILQLAWKSLLPGVLATLMTAAVVAAMPPVIFT